MCFGNDTKTSTKTTETAIDPSLAGASRTNITRLNTLADQGYQAYQGPRVADLTSDTTAAHGMIRGLAGTSNPYEDITAGAGINAATQGPQQISTTRAIDNVPGQGAAGTTQDYMDPYIQSVLAPQLADLEEEAARRSHATNAGATMAGAFGDSGWGFQTARDADLTRRARQAAIGGAYSNAFDRALATKTGDINRNLDVSKSNAALNEQGLTRALAGGQALTQADAYNTGRTADLAALQGRAGQEQQANMQQRLDAAYQEYTKGNLSAADMYQLLNSAINGSPLRGQGTSNATTTQPDNSGLGILGSLGGTAMKGIEGLGGALGGMGGALAGSAPVWEAAGAGTGFGASTAAEWAPLAMEMFAMSDRRMKENIAAVGALADGQTVYRFNYVGDPKPQIGLMAQEVEQTAPDAVHEIGGVKFVDYGRATARAAEMMKA